MPVFVRTELGEVFANNFLCMRRNVCTKLPKVIQLQNQAFAQVTGPNPDRSHTLNNDEYFLDILNGYSEWRCNILQAHGQEATFFERVNDQFCDRIILGV